MTIFYRSKAVIILLFIGVISLFGLHSVASAAEGQPYTKSRLLSLSVGVSRFQDEILNLRYAAKDARDFSRAMQKRTGQDTAQFRVLCDDKATRLNVLSALDAMIKQATRDDTIALFFSGHGINIGGHYYIGVAGLRNNQRQATGLLWDTVLERVLSLCLKSKRVIVFLDSCHSGAVARKTLWNRSIFPESRCSVSFVHSHSPHREVPSDANLLGLRVENLAILTACQPDESSMEGGNGIQNGVFTEALLEALAGKADIDQNGAITYSELYSYVQARVLHLTIGFQHPAFFVGAIHDLDISFVGQPRDDLPPACRIIEPKPNVTVTSGTVRVIVEATDDKEIEKLVIAVNGVRVPDSTAKAIVLDDKTVAETGDRAIPVGHKVRRLYAIDVPLPPGVKNVSLSATVSDDKGNDATAGLSVLHANTPSIKGSLYLLSVGITHYQNPDYALHFAAQDAKAIADLMRQQQGKQYQRVVVDLLRDDEATASRITQELQQLQKAVKPNDTVMVFLSGHGVQSKGKFYFATYEIKADDIAGTCLEWQQVNDALANIYATKLVFIDACHSGSKMGQMQATTGDLAQAAPQQTGALVFASCQGDQFSYEDKTLGHGAFAAALLEAFQGKANKDASQGHVVTLVEMLGYVSSRLIELEKGVQNPQLVSVQNFNPIMPLVKSS